MMEKEIMQMYNIQNTDNDDDMRKIYRQRSLEINKSQLSQTNRTTLYVTVNVL